MTFKFKKPFTVIIDIILHEKHIIKNATNCREPREFVQKIIGAAKNAGFTETRIQFDIIYNAVEFELRRDLRRPDNVSIFSLYFANMDDCEHFWWVSINKHKFNVGGNNQDAKLCIQYENRFQQYGQYRYQYSQYDNAFNRGIN